MTQYKLQTYRYNTNIFSFDFDIDGMIPKDAGEFDTIEEANAAGDEARKNDPHLFYQVMDAQTGKRADYGMSRQSKVGMFPGLIFFGICGIFILHGVL